MNHSKSAKIKVSLYRNSFSESVILKMWDLYKASYEYAQTEFLTKITTYDYISFFKQEEEIVGFVGIKIDRPTLHGQDYLLIRFGQAVIQPQHRGKSLIPTTGLKLCQLLWKDILFRKVFFWADNLTYKSYLVFAKTVPEYYPSYQQSTPYLIKEVIDFIGQERYSTTYDKATGTVWKNRNLVNDVNCEVCFKYLQDPDINFFTKANPFYTKGHGLITITPMNRKNILVLIERGIWNLFSNRKRKGKKISRQAAVMTSTA